MTARTCATCDAPALPLRAHCQTCSNRWYGPRTAWVDVFLADPKEADYLERHANTPIRIGRDRE